MKTALKRGAMAGLAVLMLMAFASGAWACLADYEPGKGFQYGPGFSRNEFHPRDEFVSRGWRQGILASLQDDSDERGYFGRMLKRGGWDGPRWNTAMPHFLSWGPFWQLGGKWADSFKDFDLDKFMDRIEDNPAFILIGGFRRPMFIGLIFPFDFEGNGSNGNQGQGGSGNNVATPIPGAALLLGTGMAGLGVLRLKRRRAQG